MFHDHWWFILYYGGSALDIRRIILEEIDREISDMKDNEVINPDMTNAERYKYGYEAGYKEGYAAGKKEGVQLGISGSLDFIKKYKTAEKGIKDV